MVVYVFRVYTEDIFHGKMWGAKIVSSNRSELVKKRNKIIKKPGVKATKIEKLHGKTSRV